MYKPCVLVIDDDANTRALMELWLHHRGFQPILAEDGARGLALALSAQPDCILLDLALPIHHGMEVYGWLQDSAATASIPIILISASARASELAQWRELPQIHAVLQKPFDLDDLTQLLRGLIEPALERSV